jgi:hypothetical protein
MADGTAVEAERRGDFGDFNVLVMLKMDPSISISSFENAADIILVPVRGT